MQLVEMELPTIVEHLNSSPCFGRLRVTQSLGFCVVFFFVDSCFAFLHFLLATVLPVLLRITTFDQPFVIFKYFLRHMHN